MGGQNKKSHKEVVKHHTEKDVSTKKGGRVHVQSTTTTVKSAPSTAHLPVAKMPLQSFRKKYVNRKNNRSNRTGLNKAANHLQNNPINNQFIAATLVPNEYISRGPNTFNFIESSLGSWAYVYSETITTGNTVMAVSATPDGIDVSGGVAILRTAQAASWTAMTSNPTWVTRMTGPSINTVAATFRMIAFELTVTAEGNAFNQQGDAIAFVKMTGSGNINPNDPQSARQQPLSTGGTMYPGQALIAHQFAQNENQYEFAGGNSWQPIQVYLQGLKADCAFRFEIKWHIEYVPLPNFKPLVQTAISEVNSLAINRMTQIVNNHPTLAIGFMPAYNAAKRVITRGCKPGGFKFGGIGGLGTSTSSSHANYHGEHVTNVQEEKIIQQTESIMDKAKKTFCNVTEGLTGTSCEEWAEIIDENAKAAKQTLTQEAMKATGNAIIGAANRYLTPQQMMLRQ